MPNTILGSIFNDRLPGTILDDEVFANSGNDTLVGSFGNDTLDGQGDHDTADYSKLRNTVTLGAFGSVSKGALGTDLLRSIEHVIGSRLDGDTIDLSAAISTPPAFTVAGGTIDLSLGTVVVNGSGGGLPVSVQVSDFEDVLGTIYNDTLIGNRDGNKLNGNAGDDLIDGKMGRDLLLGGDGNDTLVGGSGADTLIGGAGQDRLIGGSGIGTFRWSTKEETLAGVGDSITDFSSGDVLDFKLIDACESRDGNQAFTWIRNRAFDGEGQLRFQFVSGGVLIQGNTLSTSGAELDVFLAGVTATTAGLARVGLPANFIL